MERDVYLTLIFRLIGKWHACISLSLLTNHLIFEIYISNDSYQKTK